MVDLPQPEGPTKAANWPGGMVMDKSLSRSVISGDTDKPVQEQHVTC